jgi:MFS family permease
VGIASALKRVAHNPDSIDVENCTDPVLTDKHCWVTTTSVHALSVMTGAATGVAFPAHTALAMENARGLGMGTVMSLLLTVHSLGMTLCPLLFGLIADHFGMSSTFYGGGLLCALAAGACHVLTTSPALTVAKALDKEASVAD